MNVKGAVLEFPKHDRKTGPEFRDLPARTNRRLHISAEEGRRRLLAGTLPPWSVILGSLHFSFDDKPVFPPNTRVCGMLTLYDCYQVTKLANGLRVDGDLDITGTSIKKLPRLLRVFGRLSISNNWEIKGVPRDLFVRYGVEVDEYGSASLRRLAGKRPVKWLPQLPQVINF